MPTCRRCDNETLVPASGALGEAVCAQCGGRLLDEPMTTSLFIDQLGWTREQLMSGASSSQACATCNAARIVSVDVEGTPTFVCVACGCSWLDSGALTALTQGRIEEIRPQARRNDAVAVVSRELIDGNGLVDVFARAGFRTPADARLLGTGHGLIVERATRVEAERLIEALKAAGVLAEMIDTVDVTMPALRVIIDVRLAADELLLVDNRKKSFSVRYSDVAVASLGVVKLLKTQRAPPPKEHFTSMVGRTLGRRPVLKTPDILVERSESPVLEIVNASERLRVTTESLDAKLAPGVTKETAFRAVARAVLQRLPERVRTASAQALVDSPLARIQHHAPREWDCMVAWERWRATRTVSES